MSIKFKGKVGVSDASWAFRFLAKPNETVDEFYKYHPDKNPSNPQFCIAEKYVPELASIYLMMPYEARFEALKNLHQSKNTHTNYTARILMELMLSLPKLTEDEIHYIADWIEHLTTVHQLAFIEKVFQHESRSQLIHAFIEKGHDFFISYILLRGNEDERALAQKTVLEHNYGGSLQVLKFAQANGLITAQSNETELFVNHFRQGNVHTETSRLLKKFKEQVKEALTPNDPIFQASSNYFEEWCLAVNLLFQKNPTQAQAIFTRVYETRVTKNRYDYHERSNVLMAFLNAGPVAYQCHMFLQEMRNVFLNGDFYDSDYRLTQNTIVRMAKLFKYAPLNFWNDIRLSNDDFIFDDRNKNKQHYYNRNFHFINALRMVADARYQLNIQLPEHAPMNTDYALNIMNAVWANKNEREMLKNNIVPEQPWKLLTPLLEDTPVESELYF